MLLWRDRDIIMATSFVERHGIPPPVPRRFDEKGGFGSLQPRNRSRHLMCVCPEVWDGKKWVYLAMKKSNTQKTRTRL